MRTYISFVLKLSAISLTLFLLHNLSPVQRIEQAIFSSPRAFFSIFSRRLGNRLFATASFVSELPRLRQEVASLKEDNLSLRAEVVSLKEDSYRLSILEKELQLFHSLDDKVGLAEARVIKVERFPSGKDVFLLDKGSLAGIREGDAVSFQNFLLGRVSQVFPRSAVVVSVWDSSFTATCFDQDSPTRLEGVCSVKGGVLLFSNLEPGVEFNISDVILTSGRDSFPQGRILGKVSKIEGGFHQLNRFAVVEPFLSHLPDLVFVEISRASD